MMSQQGQSSSDLKRYSQESTLTNKVKEWLEVQRDIHFYKASDRYHKGISDFILCVRGTFVGVELKKDDGKPSPHQLLFIKQTEQAGGIGGVCYTLADVKALVEKARCIHEVRRE
jgi:hypothetical protein